MATRRNASAVKLIAALSIVVAIAIPSPARAQVEHLALIPQPQQVKPLPCRRTFDLTRSIRVARNFDAAAFEEINERWHALGIPELVHGDQPEVLVVRSPRLPPQAYRLVVPPVSEAIHIFIVAGDDAGAFYAAMTLAQLPQRVDGRWQLPCVAIADQPALHWRILSDDVSRGPLPTMHYFKERIRTIAAFKMNGYSPYMEHVFLDPRNPLPAPLDGITPPQLRELAQYSRRFHVTFIPEQQTFAHMHNTLRWEEYAPAAELPHGYLMSPVNPLTYQYLQQVISDELAAVPNSPFFHIGSDEPIDLGRGQSQAAVASQGDAAVYAAHVSRVASLVHGARVMIWDDAIQRQPQILDHIPKSTVIVNWKYGAEKTFLPYIRTIASRGFEQMVAPGANNWTEIYPDLPTALPNEERFINEGKSAHVLGLFQTVWHDDGETLYEATWFPVIYAAAAAWEGRDVMPQRFAADFSSAFFGSADARFNSDIQTLGNVVHTLDAAGSGPTDVLFWADPFDNRIAGRLSDPTLSSVRNDAERVLRHLAAAQPPLHRNAARVMALAARRLDYLARDFQIGREARYYYNDARTNQTKLGIAVRSLFVSKYLLWEMRDNMEELAPLYAAAWDYENRAGHRASALERYQAAAQSAIARADRIAVMTSEDFLKEHRFPTFDETLGLPPAP